ncbi:GTPase-associated system all-helical protein GASH [Burkholderia gladioli]|uniref:GTPase-associated system all-helical protein GASH n=1 Tax=Burkholderia gladioli TaxID=28095 RepID=UPI00163EDD9F|nr:GTPase-associated system all-helical protein GASH [Burkholderia gladioli]
MSEALKRAGVLYGKLGITPPVSLIESRYPGIEAAARALTLEQLPELVKAMFGLSGDAKEAAFLGHFSEDPTFDVRPADKEAALIATAVADYAITEGLDLGGHVALTIITAGMGGMRPLSVPSEICAIADAGLTARQSGQTEKPALLDDLEPPQTLVDAIKDVKGQPPAHNFLTQILAAIGTAFDQVQTYIEGANQQAVDSNNALVAHIATLEEQMQIHWWVVGGWSDETGAFFRDQKPVEAAIQAAWELAGKGSAPLGLHAAPALLGQVLERGRTGMDDVTLADASVGATLAWRKDNFEPLAAAAAVSLLPVSALFAFSAASGDEPDWKATFKRRTGIKTDATINPIDLGVQLYRERLVRKLLKV